MHTPPDSEGVITVPGKVKLQAAPLTTFVSIQLLICAEHWLGPSLAVVFIGGNIAGTQLPITDALSASIGDELTHLKKSMQENVTTRV